MQDRVCINCFYVISKFDDDILKHLGRHDFMLECDKQLLKKMTVNYDDFNLKTSWQMKKKFVFAKPGKKRFVS